MPNANPNAGFIAHWKRVGPILQRIRDDELRQFDFDSQRHIADALLQMGATHSVQRTTSGLIELQRLKADLVGHRLSQAPCVLAKTSISRAENSIT